MRQAWHFECLSRVWTTCKGLDTTAVKKCNFTCRSGDHVRDYERMNSWEECKQKAKNNIILCKLCCVTGIISVNVLCCACGIHCISEWLEMWFVGSIFVHYHPSIMSRFVPVLTCPSQTLQESQCILTMSAPIFGHRVELCHHGYKYLLRKSYFLWKSFGHKSELSLSLPWFRLVISLLVPRLSWCPFPGAQAAEFYSERSNCKKMGSWLARVVWPHLHMDMWGQSRSWFKTEGAQVSERLS